MNRHLRKYWDGVAALVGVIILSLLAWQGVHTYKKLEVEKSDLLAELDQSREDNYKLLLAIEDKDKTIDHFQGQLGEITSTVGTLEKLSQTDEELLKKYSKIYFLNENYIPATLTDIDTEYVYKGSANFLIHAKVWPHLRDLFQAAQSAGLGLKSASSFRSFGTQAALKSGYLVTYGTGANTFSADQGYSEHQLGTALDFTTDKLGAGFSGFAADPAYKWLEANAYKYGFILSYPDKNAYYKFEPWHWRYVGIALATYLHNEGKHFYDLDQREINTYLVKLFD